MQQAQGLSPMNTLLNPNPFKFKTVITSHGNVLCRYIAAFKAWSVVTVRISLCGQWIQSNIRTVIPLLQTLGSHPLINADEI
jgi:hypothetical protein